MHASNHQPGPALEAACDSLHQVARQLANEVSRRPLAALAVSVGVGYIAGKLPLLRILVGAVRAAIPLAPPLLAVVGAARVWDLIDPADVRVSDGRGSQEGAALNELLATALAALESYDGVTLRFDGDDRRVLGHIRAVHAEGVRCLQEAIKETGTMPIPGRGPWEGLAGLLAQPVGRLAETPLFAFLLEVEGNVARTYEAALSDPSLRESNKNLIRRHLLPRAHENVTTLLGHKSRVPFETASA